MLKVTVATEADVPELTSLRSAVADRLTHTHGSGHWSLKITEKAVARAIQTSRVLVARHGRSIVGTLRLATRKPWAIDASMFMPVRRPLYLLDMAVAPESQGRGFGQHLVEEAKVAARASLAGAIWLDAYDAPAGAGAFYTKCGFREVGRAVYRGVPLVYYEWIA